MNIYGVYTFVFQREIAITTCRFLSFQINMWVQNIHLPDSFYQHLFPKELLILSISLTRKNIFSKNLQPWSYFMVIKCLSTSVISHN